MRLRIDSGRTEGIFHRAWLRLRNGGSIPDRNKRTVALVAHTDVNDGRGVVVTKSRVANQRPQWLDVRRRKLEALLEVSHHTRHLRVDVVHPSFRVFESNRGVDGERETEGLGTTRKQLVRVDPSFLGWRCGDRTRSRGNRRRRGTSARATTAAERAENHHENEGRDAHHSKIEAQESTRAGICGRGRRRVTIGLSPVEPVRPAWAVWRTRRYSPPVEEET